MRNRNGQDGVAMITVMMIVVVLSLLMVASLNYALQGEPPSRRDQDWNAALAAAQAGVDDYLYRLQQDQDYLQYSATNPPTPANVAFTGWHNIPGPSNLGQFHYSVSNVTSQGIVQVVSTGRVRSVQRTVRANLRRRGFLDYLYLTDYESLDPQSGYYSDPTTATSRCSEYWWQGRSTSYCVRISFVTGDTINGPLHTNDTISVNGNPRFNGKATTAYTGAMSCTASASFTWRWYGLSGCSDRPVFQTGDPEAVPILPLPSTNTAIKAETDRRQDRLPLQRAHPDRAQLLGHDDRDQPVHHLLGVRELRRDQRRPTHQRGHLRPERALDPDGHLLRQPEPARLPDLGRRDRLRLPRR